MNSTRSYRFMAAALCFTSGAVLNYYTRMPITDKDGAKVGYTEGFGIGYGLLAVLLLS